jgi:GMP synthase (glutamine-hydrolysing)
MRINCFQHAPFEGPAAFEHWAAVRGHTLRTTKLYENDPLPDLESFDFLLIMGGPMNIDEEALYPWLLEEKRFIHNAIRSGKTVIGVCLGAQLIADLLDGKVYKGEHKEIGWFPITFSQAARASKIFGFLPEQITVFHWHGDTFTLPPQAAHIAESEGCRQQAFLYNDRVLGLQFHLEMTEESLQQMVQNGENELIDGRYIQHAEEIRAARDHLQVIHNALFGILDRLPSCGQ